MPRRFVLPPLVARLVIGVSPMMNDSRATLRNSRRVAQLAVSPSPGERLAPLIIYSRVLQVGRS